MKDFSHFYAWEYFIDILIFYDIEDIECGVVNRYYCDDKSMYSRTYEMYVNYKAPHIESRFKDVYSFIDLF